MSDVRQKPPPPERAESAPDSDFPSRASGVRPSAEDLIFVNELCAAGLLGDLRAEELAYIAEKLGEVTGVQRRIDLLELYYYHARGDAGAARARRLNDRFFMHREEDAAATARVLVQRLAELAPELPEVQLERIGDDPTDPLVLRSGEHFAAVVDDYEEAMDTGEVDLREIEGPSVGVRGLVQALNVLLDRHGVRERLVELRCDDERECYLATTMANAMNLCKSGYLAEETLEELMELCAW